MPLHTDHEGRIFYPYNPHTLTDADVHYKGVILRPGAAPIHTFTLNGDRPIRHHWEEFRSQAIEKLKEFDVKCVGLACRQRRQLRAVSPNPDDSTTIIITVNEMPSMSANKLESLLDDIRVQSGHLFVELAKAKKTPKLHRDRRMVYT